MGPRSHERGNKLCLLGTGPGHNASMGPRSHERGNVAAAGAFIYKALLQWGRVLTNAETDFALYGRKGVTEASMGPRSHERGNSPRWPRGGD